MSAAERMRRMRKRRRADGFTAVITWVPREQPPPPPLEVRLLHARALALHVRVAVKIDRHPELLDVARQNLLRWRERDNPAPGVAIRSWSKVMRLPWLRIGALTTEQSEPGIRLRNITPFTGILTPLERKRVYDAFRTGS
jgi:hypothetical protein